MGALLSQDEILYPRPDFMVGIGCLCDSASKSGAVIAERLGLPFFMVDISGGFSVSEESEIKISEEGVKYYAGQYREMIAFLEQHTSEQLDMDRLKDVYRMTNEALGLWSDISELKKVIPCPAGAMDEVVTLFIPMALTGTPEAIMFLQGAKTEMQERVKKGQGVIDEEKHRLLLVGGPVWWYDIGLLNYFEDLGGVLVKADLDVGWAGGRLDPDQPAESWARRMINNFAYIDSLPVRINYLKKLIADYNIDGLIILSHWGCRVLGGQNLAIKDIIYRDLGIPSLILDGDLCDDRHRASREQDLNRIEEFMEMLE